MKAELNTQNEQGAIKYLLLSVNQRKILEGSEFISLQMHWFLLYFKETSSEHCGECIRSMTLCKKGNVELESEDPYSEKQS